MNIYCLQSSKICKNSQFSTNCSSSVFSCIDVGRASMTSASKTKTRQIHVIIFRNSILKKISCKLDETKVNRHSLKEDVHDSAYRRTSELYLDNVCVVFWQYYVIWLGCLVTSNITKKSGTELAEEFRLTTGKGNNLTTASAYLKEIPVISLRKTNKIVRDEKSLGENQTWWHESKHNTKQILG